MDATHTLCKQERLCGKKAISDLFNGGSVFFQYPYKILWLKIPADLSKSSYPSCFAISVPKRRFKPAVKRNLIKRRTREVYRINKQILNDVIKDGQQMHLIAVYTSDNILSTKELECAMKKILHRIALQYVESD